MSDVPGTRSTKKAKHAPPLIPVKGGPLDGWIVKPGAPCLESDWYTTWPENYREGKFEPGHYEVDGETAIWKEDSAS